jgi:histidinol phosphatase-like enzyme
MVFEALKAEGVTPETAKIYVIGDRATDVQTALNINECGILIPFENEPGELDKTQMLQEHSRICIVENLPQAAKFIYRQEQ